MVLQLIAIAVLSIFCLLMFWKLMLKPWLTEVREPLSQENLVIIRGKISAIRYGVFQQNTIDVAEIPDFVFKFEEAMSDPDAYAPIIYNVQIGYQPTVHTSGRVIHSTIKCTSYIDAYITARVQQHVVSKQINNDGIFYRITKA